MKARIRFSRYLGWVVRTSSSFSSGFLRRTAAGWWLCWSLQNNRLHYSQALPALVICPSCSCSGADPQQSYVLTQFQLGNFPFFFFFYRNCFGSIVSSSQTLLLSLCHNMFLCGVSFFVSIVAKDGIMIILFPETKQQDQLCSVPCI